MKNSYLLFLLCAIGLGIPGTMSAQMEDTQSLSKYSYPIFAMSENQQFTGTGFFYHQGDTSFLVSNYHAIKGMSPMRKTINFIADSLYIKYTDRNTGELKMLTIDNGPETTGETEIFSMVDRIDLLKVPVDLPASADIHFINDLIDADYLNETPEEVVVFGYPTNPGTIPAFYSQQQSMRGEVNPNGFADYDAAIQLNFPGTSDSARAIMYETSRYYYFIKPYAAQGYSGAPVFGKFNTPDGRTIYRFTGVIFAGQPSIKQTWAIKGSVALQYLKGEL